MSENNNNNTLLVILVVLVLFMIMKKYKDSQENATGVKCSSSSCISKGIKAKKESYEDMGEWPSNYMDEAENEYMGEWPFKDMDEAENEYIQGQVPSNVDGP